MTILFVLFLSAAAAQAGEPAAVTQRLGNSADVMHEIMAIPEKGVPHDLLDNAHCIVIVPGLKKGAFVIGAKYGKGFLSCRREDKGWSAPAAVRIEGGSFGFQIGGSETDVVLLVMNKKGADRLLSTRFTLGGEGEVAAGPVGRNSTAQTDLGMRAGILSYSRSRGVFLGIALTGATLRQDLDDNRAMYGRSLTNREIVNMRLRAPTGAVKLMAELNQYSPREKI